MLVVKRNQRTLYREAKAAFDDAERAFAPEKEDRCQIFECKCGCSEWRTCTVLGGLSLCEGGAVPEVWPGLRSLSRVQAERTGSHDH